MRNRAVEIRLSDEEHFVRSTVDKIRLLGCGALEMRMIADAGRSELEAALDFEIADLLRIQSFAANDREKILNLAALTVDESAASARNFSQVARRTARAVNLPSNTAALGEYLRAHYADAWLFYLRQSDPAIAFFYARVAGGVDEDLALTIATTERKRR